MVTGFVNFRSENKKPNLNIFGYEILSKNINQILFWLEAFSHTFKKLFEAFCDGPVLKIQER